MGGSERGNVLKRERKKEGVSGWIRSDMAETRRGREMHTQTDGSINV